MRPLLLDRRGRAVLAIDDEHEVLVELAVEGSHAGTPIATHPVEKPLGDQVRAWILDMGAPPEAGQPLSHNQVTEAARAALGVRRVTWLEKNGWLALERAPAPEPLPEAVHAPPKPARIPRGIHPGQLDLFTGRAAGDDTNHPSRSGGS